MSVPVSESTSRVLLTGASGMIGSTLAASLRAHGAAPVEVRRPGLSGAMARSQAGPGNLLWNPDLDQPFTDPSALEGLDAAVHLSGANLSSQRWTSAFKQEIVNSRTRTTAALARTLAGLEKPPRVLISASATGIYGDRGEEVLDESAPPGTGFLPETCEAWEAATSALALRRPSAGVPVRVVHLRIGVVLAAHGGALRKMLPLFRLGLGGRLGSGKQWMSWVTLPDVLAAIRHLLDSPDAAGPYNCVAPNPVTNAQFTEALAATLQRPALFPAPAFALRIALGEMADAALLPSCRAVPRRLLASGFRFAHPEIRTALPAILAR